MRGSLGACGGWSAFHCARSTGDWYGAEQALRTETVRVHIFSADCN